MKTITKIYYFILCFIEKVFFHKKIIAIKHPSAFRNQKKWGDYNVACDLANEINENKIYFAIPVPQNFWYSTFNKFVDVTILFRGLLEYIPYKNQINYMYAISNYNEVNCEEYYNYERVFSMSLKNPCGEKYCFLPAFANTNFYYPVKSNNPKYRYDILFIGNTRSEYRNVVKYCVNNGINIAVFGSGWEKFIDKKYIKGHLIPNKKVKYYYSNSKIILADHFDDMRKLGAISNRIYNISACKGFCICDDVKGLDEVFEGAIPVFRTEKELVDLINYYLEHPQERYEKAQKAYDITIKKFTAKNIVQILLKDLKFI